jgi:hypothetical protein
MDLLSVKKVNYKKKRKIFVAGQLSKVFLCMGSGKIARVYKKILCIICGLADK